MYPNRGSKDSLFLYYDDKNRGGFMEEKIDYYENYLIPVLKKKIYDVQSVLADLEANIVYLKEKNNKIQMEIDKVKSEKVSGDSYE